MNIINKKGFEDHLKEIKKEAQTKLHKEVLKELMECLEKVNYLEKAFPKLTELNNRVKALFDYCGNPKNKNKEDFKGKEEELKLLKAEINSMKLMEKHLLIISVNEIQKMAKRKKFGLCINRDFIYLYNGEFWKSIDKKEFEKFLGEASEKMGVGKFTAEYFLFREKLYKQFTATGYLPAPNKPKDKVLINLNNGTFEISNKPILRSFDPVDFMRYQLPFSYDAKAEAPKFENYLNRVLPEEDKQKVLAEFLGYIFIPASQLKLEKALFLYGGGANGKSVLYDIIKALLGNQNTSEYTLQSLTDSNGYYRAQIADKLANYATEISGKLESSKFKSLASGEPMEARLPYKDPFIIEDYAKLIFNTNELPKDVEFTNAFFRRFIIIPFEVRIPEKEQNKELANEIIKDELPGVFNWVLDGLRRIVENRKFSESPSIDKALNEFRTESDTVKRFIEENEYLPDLQKKILLKELYPEYKQFAFDEGNRVLSKPNFKKRLESLKIQVRRESDGIQVYISLNKNEASIF
ncbi:phage/plasmid primase, P4 family [Cyclobacterium sp. 1_MG-2023]|uniref:DNA primase family protein n=1 Tax=Cyclobacterium sp. 1_MG-2023 TaxID=3062681 RepID=UPI0026E3A3BA|nr:DNA primase family protein [Cyclobacterium sp. 1_MG-2023]MDO6437132.1 phage/plasmid primase, P4 family [Cyclobacterium sp. 1_MG-2023]